MTSNDSLALPQALGDVREHTVSSGLIADLAAQSSQRLPVEVVLSRSIPDSDSRGSRQVALQTPADNRQVIGENINEAVGRDIPSRPRRQTRGTNRQARPSLRTRTSQRLRMRESSSSRASSSSEAVEQPQSQVDTTVNQVINQDINITSATVHELMYRPMELDEATQLIHRTERLESPELDYGDGTDVEEAQLYNHESSTNVFQRRQGQEYPTAPEHEFNPGLAPTRSQLQPVLVPGDRPLLHRPYVPLPSLASSDSVVAVPLPTPELLDQQESNRERYNMRLYSERLSDTRDQAPRISSTVVPSIEPSNIPAQVQSYLKNWRSTRPEFVEPIGNMRQLPPGSIPPPMLDRGNMYRRIESCVPFNALQVVRFWKRLEYHVKFVTMPQMVMAGLLQRIFTDLQKYQHNPLRPSGSYDLNLGGAVKQWIDWIRKRSSLIQSIYLFRSRILRFLKSLEDMVKYAKAQYKIFNKVYTVPTPVLQGESQGRMIIYGMDQILSYIAGHGYDKCLWSKAQSATLFLSDHFRRQLYDEMGYYFKFKEVDIQDQFPWLVRFTENIDRDAPNQYAIYRSYITSFPDGLPTAETVLDRHLNHPIQCQWLIMDLCREEMIGMDDNHQEVYNDRQFEKATSSSGTSHERSSSSSDRLPDRRSETSTQLSQMDVTRGSHNLYYDQMSHADVQSPIGHQTPQRQPIPQLPSREMNIRDLGDQMNNSDYLRARLAEIEARRNATPYNAENFRDEMFPSASTTPGRNYHESTNPLAISSGQQARYSGKFLIPRDMEGLRVHYGRTNAPEYRDT